MTRLTPRLSSHLLFWSLLATTPLMAMDVPKDTQKPSDGSKDVKTEKKSRLRTLEDAVLGLRKHVDTKAHETREDALMSHGIHSQKIAALETEVADLAAKVETSENEIGTVFARYDQTSRESMAHFREELTKCSEERFVRLEENAVAHRAAHNELSARFTELRESLARLGEIRANAGGEAGQQDDTVSKLAFTILREDIQRQIGELNRDVGRLNEALFHEESSPDNKLHPPVDPTRLLEKVHALIEEVEGKMDGLEELFDIGIKELKTNIDDLEVFYDNELIELHTRVKDLPTFEEQLQTFCINHAQSVNHPITALILPGLYHALDGSEQIEKLASFIDSNLEITTDPKPIIGLVRRTILANILNALLPKTGLVSRAKNGWAYMASYVVADLATEWSYPLVSGYVPEQVADQVTSRYQQLPEFAQTGLPWLGKSLLAFAIAPSA